MKNNRITSSVSFLVPCWHLEVRKCCGCSFVELSPRSTLHDYSHDYILADSDYTFRTLRHDPVLVLVELNRCQSDEKRHAKERDILEHGIGSVKAFR